MIEEWRAIPGYEGFYEVSSAGRVKALAREIVTKPKGVWTTRILPVRILKTTEARHGYRTVEFKTDAGRKRHLVHRLVALAFIPNVEGAPHVNHIDAHPWNNAVVNLEWVTHKQNMEHAARLGRMVSNSGPGEESPAHKLTTEEVIQIKLRLMMGDRVCKIAIDHPVVTSSAIREIKAGRSWGHIKVPQDMYHEAMARRAA